MFLTSLIITSGILLVGSSCFIVADKCNGLLGEIAFIAALVILPFQFLALIFLIVVSLTPGT